jgi:CHAT domain-containing protein
MLPSLHSLTQLWERDAVRYRPVGDGLILAVSDFQGRHHPLPQTMREVEAMSRACPGSQVLHDEAATWPAFYNLAAGQGLVHFSFLHMASHAFHDNVTGRLSGLALYDRDVWLDELWDCAPLPKLVTLSACSGSKSRLYEGDEHVGLVTTCLAAGAQHVVASLWPVLDQDAVNLMVAFYSYLTANQRVAGPRITAYGVARALALAQRAAWQAGKAPTQWGGFCCTGLP